MEYLTFASLETIPGLCHAVTTRHGGVSVGEYASLNLAFHVGDDAEAVRENRRILGRMLDYDAASLVAAQQVHGSECRVVTASEKGSGAFEGAGALADCDALIVQEPNIPVLIMVADCAPILLVDPVTKVLAVVHAGWRGAVGAIASKAAGRMAAEFGSRPEDIQAGIGPCLCTACLEIGEEVAEQVPGAGVVRKKEWKKPHLDLRAIIREDLTNGSVPGSQIKAIVRCPRCENERFFSHRGQNGKAGRFGLVAYWRE